MKFNFRKFLRDYRYKLLILLLVASVFIPSLSIFFLLLTGLFGLVISLLQLSTTFPTLVRLSAQHQSITRPQTEPFVSIHLASHNEPPKIVKKALDALAAINYQNYEVLVIDNNTADPKLWKPLEQHCQKLGSKFRFIHVENLKGFKSGALNLALQHMSPRAEILALVDADYIVDKDFLKRSVLYFQDPQIALVQYPQDYLNTTAGNVGMSMEYQSFFSALMAKANQLDAVTVTGTMGLLRTDLFRKDLRWNEWCITEDTELGVHLHGLGYRGVYLNESRGKGLMPLDYYSLHRQRQRWAFGNMQVILKDFWSIVSNTDLTWLQKRSFLTQLTAWFHPNLVPMVILLASLLVAPFMLNSTLVLSMILAVAILWLFCLTKIVYFTRTLSRAGTLTIRNLIMTLLAHYGLSSVMSTAWIYALLKTSLSYNRTNKDPEEAAPKPIPRETVWASALIISGVVALIISPSLIVKLVALSTLLFGVFLLVAVTSLLQQLRVTQKITKEIVQSW